MKRAAFVLVLLLLTAAAGRAEDGGPDSTTLESRIVTVERRLAGQHTVSAVSTRRHERVRRYLDAARAALGREATAPALSMIERAEKLLPPAEASEGQK